MSANLSYWETTLLGECDVAIVGAGLMGLWSAYFLKLKHPHMNIHVYDKDGFGLGASSRNAGFACFGTLGELVADSHKSSFTQALECVINRYKGLIEIQEFSQKYQLNIDYEPLGGTEMLTASEHECLMESLPGINEALYQELRLKNVYHSLLPNEAPPFKSGYHYIFNPYEGGLNSAKLLFGLSHIVQRLGVKVFHGFQVAEVNSHHLLIKNSEREFEVKSKMTILAVNAFAKELININIKPARGQILWGTGLNLGFKGAFHFHEGFYYFRTIGENHFLIGGARHLDMEKEQTTVFNPNPKLQNHLLSFVHHELLMKDFTIDNAWQGMMGFSNDKQPVIQEFKPDMWHLHGCNGMGVAMTPIIAKKFVEKI